MKNFDAYEMNEDYEYDIPVGETFNYKGMTLKVVQDNGSYCCNDCFFAPKKEKYSCSDFACLAGTRLDCKSIIFEEVEK